MNRPNIIYIVLHDLGRTLGCYGRPVKTPNIDAFARQSVQFNKAFCTSPACSPSRMVAMSGLYPQTSGGVGLAHMGWSLRQSVNTVVDYLNAGGYQTVHTGTNHERHAGHNRYEVDLETTWEDWYLPNPLDKAMEFLAGRKDARPLYLNIGTQNVHAVMWANATREQVEAKFGRKLDLDNVFIPQHMPDNERTRLCMAKFTACINHADACFGRFFAALHEKGHSDNSVIVFTTDHGISGTRAKGTLYDAGTEITLLVRMPRGERGGTKVDHLIPNLDFAPTWLEAAGVPIPPSLQGRSFWPLLCGGRYEPNAQIFTARNFHGQNVTHREGFVDFYDPSRSVRTADWHYIRNYTIRPRHWTRQDPADAWRADGIPMIEPRLGMRPHEELYRLGTDPLQHANLADDREYAAIKKDLAGRMTQWLVETDDHALRVEVPVRPEAPGWGDNWPIRG